MYVGRWWNDRMDCRQWGAHFPHVAGISGQSKRGAQSVVLSGGCAHPPPAPPAPLLPTDASGMVPCLSLGRGCPSGRLLRLIPVPC